MPAAKTTQKVFSPFSKDMDFQSNIAPSSGLRPIDTQGICSIFGWSIMRQCLFFCFLPFAGTFRFANLGSYFFLGCSRLHLHNAKFCGLLQSGKLYALQQSHGITMKNRRHRRCHHRNHHLLKFSWNRQRVHSFETI